MKLEDGSVILERLKVIKKLYEDTIKRGGREGIHSLIRSQKLIYIIHDYIKEQLALNGISPLKIYPPINQSSPEISMAGFLKMKNQDVSVICGNFKEEVIKEGVLLNEKDEIGKGVLSKSISINVRSQLSSLAKNFDTLYERTFAEALNLHLRIPQLIMGEVYMVPLVAYDPEKMNSKKIGWKERLPIKYIPAFRELNKRLSDKTDAYKYERVCLLIVDFRGEEPKIIDSAEDLLREGWITKDELEIFSLEGLSIRNFVQDILKVYERRHGSWKPLAI